MENLKNFKNQKKPKRTNQGIKKEKNGLLKIFQKILKPEHTIS